MSINIVNIHTVQVHCFTVSIFPGRHSLNGNQVRAPMTAMTVQSGWQPNGTVSILKASRLIEMSSEWSFSPMTWETSRKPRRITCWCTNVNVCFLNQNNCGFFWCNIRDLLDYILGEEYIKSLTANPELVDRLALSSDDKVNTSTVMTVYRYPGRETLKEIVSESTLPSCATIIFSSFSEWHHQ